MYRKIILFSLIMAFFYATAAFGTSITFSFANGQITGNDPMYYEFDVMVVAGESGTRIGDLMAYINYNTEYFGSWVKSNGKITVTAGTLTEGVLYSLMVNDNTISRVAITAEYIRPDNPELANKLLATPTQWVHIKIEIADSSKSANLSFEQSLMSGNEYQSDNLTKYSSVMVEESHKPPVDVNGDGQVDIIDIVLVGRRLGETIKEPIQPNPDVNGDGVVNILDLVLVERHFGESTAPAAPSAVDVRKLSIPHKKKRAPENLRY